MPARSARLRVGGLTLAVSAPAPTPLLDLAPALEPFTVPRGGDIRLRLSSTAPPEPEAGSLLFASGGVWSVHRHPAGRLYTFRSPVARPPTYKAVLIDEGVRAGTLHFVLGSGARYALDFPLDELLFQHRWAREGALEVHACGVLDDGGVLLFAGVSGAGKSTTARLWRRHVRGATTLSDDRIVLRRSGRGWRAHGTPWHGDGGFASPGSHPLRAVFFLRHAGATRLRPLPPPEVAARLLARSFPPAWDAVGMGGALEAAAGVAASVPAFDLAFAPDASAVRAVRSALG